MHHQPATRDGERHACAVLGGAALVLEQERAVDQLDVDAPILRGLDGAGDLDDAARGLLGIGIRAPINIVSEAVIVPSCGLSELQRKARLPLNVTEVCLTAAILPLSCRTIFSNLLWNAAGITR